MALSDDKQWAKQADEATRRRAKENRQWRLLEKYIDELTRAPMIPDRTDDRLCHIKD